MQKARVISHHKMGKIQRHVSAVSLLKKLQKGQQKAFDKQYAQRVAVTDQRQEGLKRVREETNIATDTELAKTVKLIEHKTKLKSGETEAPSAEVVFVRKVIDFNEAWRAAERPLIKAVENTMRAKQPNIKLVIGIEYLVIRQTRDYEDRDPEEVIMKTAGDPKAGVATTKALNIYNVESVKPSVRNLRKEMESKFNASLDKLNGSNWAVEKFVKLFATTHTLKVARGSSYLPTPTTYANPNGGVINIRNEDQECFRYCMLYHQSNQGEKTHRLTALEKVEDKYDYTDISYPTTFDDITLFDDSNKLMINVYMLENETNNIEKNGQRSTLQNGTGKSVIDKRGEKGHYIYIKRIERLLRICTTTFYKDMQFCPLCSKGVNCAEESLEDHLMNKHFSTTNNCNLQLPEEGTTMKFKNFKDTMTRPFIVYADFECTLV
jgi:hypothetical protein